MSFKWRGDCFYQSSHLRKILLEVLIISFCLIQELVVEKQKKFLLKYYKVFLNVGAISNSF